MIESDAGITGYGYGGGGQPGALVVKQHLKHTLVNRNLDSIDDINSAWRQMYQASLPYGRKGIAIMALSGLDLALWDLLAKAESVPVYKLLGGLKRPSVQAYASQPSARYSVVIWATRQSNYRADKAMTP